MKLWGLGRLLVCLFVAGSFFVGWTFALPVTVDGPPPGAPPCSYCDCIECYVWWTNGDNNTVQGRYREDEFGFWHFVSDATQIAKIWAAGCSTLAHSPCNKAWKLVPHHTRRVCTGAALSNLERLLFIDDSSTIDFYITDINRYVCGNCTEP